MRIFIVVLQEIHDDDLEDDESNPRKRVKLASHQGRPLPKAGNPSVNNKNNHKKK